MSCTFHAAVNTDPQTGKLTLLARIKELGTNSASCRFQVKDFPAGKELPKHTPFIFTCDDLESDGEYFVPVNAHIIDVSTPAKRQPVDVKALLAKAEDEAKARDLATDPPPFQ